HYAISLRVILPHVSECRLLPSTLLYFFTSTFTSLIARLSLDYVTAGRRFRFPPRRGMEVIENPLRELGGDLRHRRQLRDRRIAHAARRAERLQEARPNRRPDTGNRVEHRLDRALRPELLVVRDREAVGLVPYPLAGVERRRRGVEDQRVEALRLID